MEGGDALGLALPGDAVRSGRLPLREQNCQVSLQITSTSTFRLRKAKPAVAVRGSLLFQVLALFCFCFESSRHETWSLKLTTAKPKAANST